MQSVVGRFDQTFTIQLSGRARLYNTPLYNSFKDFEGTSVNEMWIGPYNLHRHATFMPSNTRIHRNTNNLINGDNEYQEKKGTRVQASATTY